MPKITIKTDDMTIDVEKGYKMIKMSDEYDTSILFGCRDGACGACLVNVIKGHDNLSKMQEDEKDFLETMNGTETERLACQCAVLGDVTLEVSE